MIPDLTARVDARRLSTNSRLDPETKSAYGQFMTPRPVAQFMASLFGDQEIAAVRLLDAGAGVGSLSAAFVEEFCHRKSRTPSIAATAYELDPVMAAALQATFADCARTLCRASFSTEP